MRNFIKTDLKLVISLAVIAAGIAVSYAVVAHAQTAASSSATSTLVAPSELQYPIAALGNCGSVNDCRDYCNNPQNQTACLNFAEQNHLMSQGAIQRARQFLSFMQGGQTPGNCNSVESCRAYCGDPAHATECLSFAEQAGFITAAQANAIKQNNGRGPGGCDSAESCAAFCNDSQNQAVCLNFAKQNGLISQGEAEDIQQSAAGLRIGLQQFPGQVVSCLKDQLGDNAVGELESGQITPNASTSAAVNACFTGFKAQIQNRFQNLIQNASSTIQACLQGVGSSTVSALTQGDFGALSGDQGDRVRECLREMNGQSEDGQATSTEGENQAMQQLMERAREQVKNQLEGLPDRVKNCVQPYIDLNPTSTNIGAIISQCMQAYGANTGPAEGMPQYPGNEVRPFLPAVSGTFPGLPLPQPAPLMNQMMRGGDNGSGGDN